MRKMYQEPMTEVIGVQMESQILTGSPTGPSYAPGVQGTRSGYNPGGAISTTWD